MAGKVGFEIISKLDSYFLMTVSICIKILKVQPETLRLSHWAVGVLL